MKPVTTKEAKNSIGRKVVFDRTGLPLEEGVITSANDRFVFVRYGTDIHSKATDPDDLRFI